MAIYQDPLNSRNQPNRENSMKGQDHAESLRYVPLSSNLVQAALAQPDASAH